MKKYFLLIILLIAFGLRLINLNQSLWLDEAAQALESARPLSQQLNIIADFHPPLYHIFLHFWMLLSSSELWMRLPSVFLGVGSVLLLIRISNSLNFKNASFLSGLFLAISPFAIWYSQEIRPYIFFTFFSLLSTYFFFNRSWTWYTLTSIITIYTSYFAPFLFLSHTVYIFILAKKELKNFLLSLSLTVLSFLPWIPSFISQLKVGTGGIFRGWTEVVSIDTTKVIPLTLAKFIFGRGSIDNNLLYILILLPVAIIFLYSSVVLSKEKRNWELLTLFFIPFLAVTLFTSIIPVAAPQRLLFILPYFLLILAVSIDKMPPIAKYFCILIVIATSLLGLGQYYIDERVQREKWREAVEYIEKKDNSRNIALFVFPSPFAPYQWYTKGHVEVKGIAPDFLVSETDLNNLEYILANKKNVYFFQYLTGLTDPEGKTLAKLKDLGYKEANIKNFAGVGFIYVLEKPI